KWIALELPVRDGAGRQRREAEGAALIKTSGTRSTIQARVRRASPPTAQAAEHVVVLAPLSPDHRRAGRHEGPLDTGLHEPNVVLVDVIAVNAGVVVADC